MQGKCPEMRGDEGLQRMLGFRHQFTWARVTSTPVLCVCSTRTVQSRADTHECPRDEGFVAEASAEAVCAAVYSMRGVNSTDGRALELTHEAGRGSRRKE